MVQTNWYYCLPLWKHLHNYSVGGTNAHNSTGKQYIFPFRTSFFVPSFHNKPHIPLLLPLHCITTTMPPSQKLNLAGAGLGSREENKRAELAKRAARKAAGMRAAKAAEPPAPPLPPCDEASGVAGPSGDDPIPPAPQAEPEIQVQDEKGLSKLIRDNEGHLAAQDVYHNLLAERDTRIGVLERDLSEAKDAARNQQREMKGYSAHLAASEKATKEAQEALEKEQAAHKQTQKELNASLAQTKEDKAFIKERSESIVQTCALRKAAEKALAAVKADYETAQSKIDELEAQISEQTTAAAEAHDFLRVVHQELGQQFEEAGLSLTPDTFVDHMRHVSHFARSDRHVSNDSNSPSQPDGPQGSIRPSTGQRKVSSIDQELREVNEHDQSGDEEDQEEEHTTTRHNLHIPKRRSQFRSEGVELQHEQELEGFREQLRVQLEEQQKQITSLKEEQEKQITSLKEEQQTEITRLKEEQHKEMTSLKEEQQKDAASLKEEQLVGLKEEYFAGLGGEQQKKIADLKQDITSKQADLEKYAKDFEKLRDAYVRADRGLPFEQSVITTNQVIKHDAATQSDPVEQPPAPTEIIRYTEVVRSATIWEAFMGSPFLQQALIAFCLTLLLYFGMLGWVAKMNPAVNGLRQIRSNQAHGAIYDLRSRIEHLIGYDSRLIG